MRAARAQPTCIIPDITPHVVLFEESANKVPGAFHLSFAGQTTPSELRVRAEQFNRVSLPSHALPVVRYPAIEESSVGGKASSSAMAASVDAFVLCNVRIEHETSYGLSGLARHYPANRWHYTWYRAFASAEKADSYFCRLPHSAWRSTRAALKASALVASASIGSGNEALSPSESCPRLKRCFPLFLCPL